MANNRYIQCKLIQDSKEHVAFIPLEYCTLNNKIIINSFEGVWTIVEIYEESLSELIGYDCRDGLYTCFGYYPREERLIRVI